MPNLGDWEIEFLLLHLNLTPSEIRDLPVTKAMFFAMAVLLEMLTGNPLRGLAGSEGQQGNVRHLIKGGRMMRREEVSAVFPKHWG